MIVPTPVLDVTPVSALAICPVKRCGWRTIQGTDDLARVLYAQHYERCHHRGSTTMDAPACIACGTDSDVLPRKQLCKPCHRAERAAKARAAYAQHGRPGRGAA